MKKLGYQQIETATDRFGRRMRVLAKMKNSASQANLFTYFKLVLLLK